MARPQRKEKHARPFPRAIIVYPSRIVATPSRRQNPPPPNEPGEDFLFHLFRGGELLQDGRPEEAKIELEKALARSPTDPKVQDLLGVALYRIGLYARAVEVFDVLVQHHPQAIEPRVNLAICLLKTGQAPRARQELEKVVAENAGHTRAWGYLGLAHQAVGDIDRALHAFTRGGHEAMARQLMDSTATAPPASQGRPPAPSMFQEIDRSADLTPTSALPQSLSAGWDALLAAADAAQPRPSPAPPHPTSPTTRQSEAPTRGPLSPTELAQRRALAFPAEGRCVLHVSTNALLVSVATGCSVRASLVRSMAYPGGIKTKTVKRRMRGRTLEEPLGGEGDAIVELEGKGELVLTPPADHELVPILLDEEPIYLREDMVGGFEATASYENGRMPAGNEAVGMVQLRGPGLCVARFRSPFFALDVKETAGAALHAPSVLGWMGRVIPRALPPSEAPAGAPSFVVFSGEGTVLLHGR